MLLPKKRAKIIAALKANPNARAVARQIGGVSSPTVRTIAKQAGIKLAVQNPGLQPEKRAKIIAALKANPNARAVARQVGGVSYATVRTIAKQAGIKLTAGRAAQGGGIPSETRATIIHALRANPNAKTVARQVGGVSRATVWRIAKQTGINLTAAKATQRAKIIAALKDNPTQVWSPDKSAA
jgi:lambda repressor-like predicted transcriptional regulator